METPSHRNLTEEELRVMGLLFKLEKEMDAAISAANGVMGADKDLVDLGRSNLQQGLAWLIRSVPYKV